MSRYSEAREIYAAYGVDTELAINKLKETCISIHCWQGDDVVGFDSREALSGGIQTTGNYPGRARSFSELCADMDVAFSLIGGKKKVNVHACYAVLTANPSDATRFCPSILRSGLNLQRSAEWGLILTRLSLRILW